MCYHTAEVKTMKRVSKPPEIRRQELLDTAMELFTRNGYEETSMGDIARAAGVAQGLCYRYFDSKQKLFQEAMDQYVRLCCERFLPVIHDRTRTIQERIVQMAQEILTSDQNSEHSGFYHAPGNQSLHEELNLKICRFLLPYVTEELRLACTADELSLKHPEMAASYLLYGQIGLLGSGPLPLEDRVDQIVRYAQLILGAG